LQGSRELGESLRSLTARDVASRDVLWVEEETPIADVAGAMRRSGAHRALVGGRGKAVGVLTTFDLLVEVEARSARSAS
jgi:CBS domain-containing protein